MNVRKFNKNNDYKELCQWWVDWGVEVHPKEALSNNGLIVSKDGIDICSGFVYSTDSYICFLEFATMNRNTTKKQREGALAQLFTSALELAKSLGFKLAMTFGEDKHARTAPKLYQWREENFNDAVSRNISQYWKILN
tara:strand:+ start:4920 stop:5333 length:414 start_codon:yes stop_codon:yes gene_type:complete